MAKQIRAKRALAAKDEANVILMVLKVVSEYQKVGVENFVGKDS